MKRRTVLITRPREQSEELGRELEAHGFQVLFFPAIQIAPPASWEACDRALDQPAVHYDGIIFGSVNGVKGFVGRVRERGEDPTRFGQMAVYAVGSKTAEEITRAGLRVDFIPEHFNAKTLAEHLTATNVRGRRFLLPRGNLGSEELVQSLRQAGAEIEPVEVYQTVAPDMAGAASLIQRILQGEIDVVTFASPSAAKNFAGVVPGGDLTALSAHTTIVAIGPSTLEAVRTLGAGGALVAGVSTAKGLADTIVQHFIDQV
jgi:uroporphyrinogen III methyltransferase/synthase